MTKRPLCPTCHSVNKSGATECRVCGTNLVRSQPKGRARDSAGGPKGGRSEANAGRAREAGKRAEGPKLIRQDRGAGADSGGTPESAPPKNPEPGGPTEVPKAALATSRAAPARVPVAGLTENPLVERGNAFLRAGRRAEATAAFEEAIRENPDDETAWLGLGRAFVAANDTRRALQSVDRALDILPDYAEAWLERGIMMGATGDADEALRAFSKALELLPGNSFARKRVAELQAKVGPTEHAAGEVEAVDRPSSAEAVRRVPAALGAAKDHDGRVRTFVDGLDEALGGGIPRGSIVVVEGTPGTMKSSLAGSLLLRNAAEAGRRGLYVTFEESAASLVNQLRSLGLDPSTAGDRVRFFDARTIADAVAKPGGEWIDPLRRVLEEANGAGRLDLVVLDSLEGLEVLAKFEDRRRQIYRLFEWLREVGVTALVVAERPDVVVGHVVVQGRWDEDFLADGVIQVRLHRVSDVDVQRRLRIMKMRGTRHETAYFALLVDEGRFRVTRAMGS